MTTTGAQRRVPPVVGLVLVAALLGYCSQQLIIPVLPPLTRELGLSEVDLGIVITLAALTLALASTRWGRVAEQRGPRAVVVGGLALALVGLLGFALVCAVAVRTDLPRPALLALMVLTRSVLFGAGLSAIPVAALAIAGASSSGSEQRTRLVGLVGAVQGGSMVLGPAAGGLLAAVELLLPVYLAPLVLAAVLVLVLVRLPAVPRATDDEPVRSTLRATDPRVLPFLAVGFALFLSLGLVQVVIGFTYQDRLGLDAQDTAGTVGAASFAIGVALVGMQAGAVPALRWTPVRLVRVGAAVAVLGYLGVTLAQSFWTLTGSMVVIAVGLGMAMPGYQSGASLAVGPADQSRISGLLSALAGSTFVIGPLAGTALYGLDDRVPPLAAAVLAATGLVLALSLRALRTARVDVPVEGAGSAPQSVPD